LYAAFMPSMPFTSGAASLPLSAKLFVADTGLQLAAKVY
jgi:hypothetical protein